MNVENKSIDELYGVLASIRSKSGCKEFFEDLCTPLEIESIAQRLYAAELLSKGCTYEEIIELTGISSATLARVNKRLKTGEGYKKYVLPRLNQKNRK